MLVAMVKRPDPKIKAKPCINYRIGIKAQYMLHQVESRVIQSLFNMYTRDKATTQSYTEQP